MSVYSVSNNYLDTYDPFWICRLLALKVGTVTILLFLCNAFLWAPQSSMMYMLMTILATLASEVLPAPTRSKKIATFIGILFLLSSSIMMFGMLAYFRIAFFIFLMGFTYLCLRLMVANPKVAAIPTLMIVFGVVNSGGGSMDFNAAANDYLYYFEFGLAGVMTILFFPDFSANIFNSGFIRILESDVANVGNPGYKNSHPAVLAALSVIHGRLPLLPERYGTLYAAIIEFQNAFMRPRGLTAEEQLLGKSVLSELIMAVKHGVPYSLNGDNAQQLKSLNSSAYAVFEKLVNGYNPCKA